MYGSALVAFFGQLFRTLVIIRLPQWPIYYLALLSLVHTISQAFQGNKAVHLSLCDLSKAFDVVSHVILLAKVGKYGVGEMVLNS
jgi:hypothetical protein